MLLGLACFFDLNKVYQPTYLRFSSPRYDTLWRVTGKAPAPICFITDPKNHRWRCRNPDCLIITRWFIDLSGIPNDTKIGSLTYDSTSTANVFPRQLQLKGNSGVKMRNFQKKGQTSLLQIFLFSLLYLTK